jgi:hypothetical protein
MRRFVSIAGRGSASRVSGTEWGLPLGTAALQGGSAARGERRWVLCSPGRFEDEATRKTPYLSFPSTTSRNRSASRTLRAFGSLSKKT